MLLFIGSHAQLRVEGWLECSTANTLRNLQVGNRYQFFYNLVPICYYRELVVVVNWLLNARRYGVSTITTIITDYNYYGIKLLQLTPQLLPLIVVVARVTCFYKTYRRKP